MSSNASEGGYLIRKENSQLKALFLKNGLLQAKQPCTNICQIMTPVICLIFTYLIKKLASDNIPAAAEFADNPYPYVFGDYTVLDSYSKKLNSSGVQTAAPSRDNPLQWYIYSCGVGCNATMLGTNDGLKAVSIPDGSILGSIVNSGSSVDNFTLDYYNFPLKWEVRNFPFFLPSTSGNVNSDVYDNITVIEKSSFQLIKNGRSGLDCLPDGAVTFKTLSNTTLNAILAANDIRDL
jgi:hypothetical protein